MSKHQKLAEVVVDISDLCAIWEATERACRAALEHRCTASFVFNERRHEVRHEDILRCLKRCEQ